MSIHRDKLRIIDANLNRIGEGLRVLEELARLSLNDTALTQQLKNMRHNLINIDMTLQGQLLQARDSGGDVGVDMEVPGEEKQRTTSEVIVANSKRVQESLRVMEEIAKSPDIALDSDNYKQVRFTLYTIEKDLLSRMLRRDKIQRMAGLYVIIDTSFLMGRNIIEVAAKTIRGGTKVIQFRDKEHGIREFLSEAQKLRKLCSEKDVIFIVNDSLEVALAVDADGLHVGRDDLPVEVARRLLPLGKILGCSLRTLDEAKTALSGGADYIGVGSMYPTSTKKATEVVGLDRLKEIRQAVDLSIVAIGGINKDNIAAVMNAGAFSAAVISAVAGATDVEGATRQLIEIIKGEQVG